MKTLVVATNRADRLAFFLNAWQDRGDWDKLIVVDDGGDVGRLDCPWEWSVYRRNGIEHVLGDEAWIISRGDAACKCFGFLQAVRDGAEWVLVLDDDCLPDPTNATPICAAHLEAMDFARCRSTVDNLRVRGLPYRSPGLIRSRLNMGLWRDVPDLDGPTALVSPCEDFVPDGRSRLANPQLRYPLCGMHLFFHRSLLPALYFPLMGRDQPFRRFDDIWAGWIFQRLAQQCGVAWSFGSPAVRHIRASDPFKNLIAEAPGIERNETLWQRIDSVRLTATELPAAAAELAHALTSDSDPYVSQLGRALFTWSRLTVPNA